MLLAIDIGNSQIVMGAYEGEELLGLWRLQSDSRRTVDEYALDVLGVIEKSGFSIKYFELDPLVIDAKSDLGIDIKVDDPSTVGADRVVNAIACKEIYGLPGVVVDFGTATTFDVIDSDGAYEGGIIAPGVLISSQALTEKAAMLPSIELAKPSTLIGKNTRDSMISGTFFGYVALVDGILGRLKKEISGDLKIIATGGVSRVIASECSEVHHIDPDLTLNGLRVIAQRLLN